MGRQIIDVTVIEARRPRLIRPKRTRCEVAAGPEWSPARRGQIDRDGRWTINRGRKREAAR